MSYRMESQYQANAALRTSLNKLTQDNWGITVLEADSVDYQPFSMCVDYSVVANICVGRFDLVINGELTPANMIQTVLTDEAHRNNGLIRQLFTPVQAYIKQTTGITFFTANQDKASFYKKFGYQHYPLVSHFVYAQPLKLCAKKYSLQKINWHDKDEQAQFKAVANRRAPVSEQLGFVQRNWLLFWFCEHFKQQEIYYAAELKAYLIFQITDGVLKLMDIVAEKIPTLAECLNYFSAEDITGIETHFIPERLDADFNPVACNEDYFFTDGQIVEPVYGFCLPDTQRG